MKRNFPRFLQNWLRSRPRLPLIIRGARQVGKTWLVRALATREKCVLLEVNFERDPSLARHFHQPDPRRIFDDLALVLDARAEPHEAILFSRRNPGSTGSGGKAAVVRPGDAGTGGRRGRVAPQIRGGLTEQMAAQQLRIAAADPAFMGQLHRWRRERGRNAELDYLLEVGARILPVEVKSGSAGGMKSLH